MGKVRRRDFTREEAEEVLKDFFLRNLSCRQISENRGMCYHTVSAWTQKAGKIGIGDFLLRFHSKPELIDRLREARRQNAELIARLGRRPEAISANTPELLSPRTVMKYKLKKASSS